MNENKFRIILIISFLFVMSAVNLFAAVWGDVNNSGSVDIVDSLLVAQYSVGLNPQGFNSAVAEVSADGTINIIDALLIAQYTVGLITQFPVEKITPVPTITVTPTAIPTGTKVTVAVKPPFASSMVLQRNMPIPVWGTAAGGGQVTVTLGSQTKTVISPSNGKWLVKLDPMAAAGPLVMTIKSSNTITLTDVYIGEVWQAAGQSNMDTRLSFYSNLAGEISNANIPLLRYYTLRQPSQPSTTWEVVSPSTAGNLSATAYFFGKEIQNKTGMAVGLVVTAVGGTTIASWLDPGTLAANPGITDSDKGTMWDAWVSPVAGYAIRGTIWIQGEQDCNSTSAPTYSDRFKLLIKGWRTAWGQGDFPFYFGQLSNIHSLQTDPNNTSYVAQVREGQRLALGLANTAMSVNFDIGTADNWHYPNKPEAGRRLSLPAKAKLYGNSSLVFSGPLYLSKSISGNKVTLYFTQTGGGLTAKNGALAGFAIAGNSGSWVWGDAVISGNTVVVSSPSVPNPARVRYGWGDNPIISLYNREGLPASSFTTDSPDLVLSD